MSSYLDRFKAYRDSILQQTKDALPTESRSRKLEVTNVRLEDTSDDRIHHWHDFQKAKETGGSFLGRVVGDVKLIDKKTGKTVDEVKDHTLNFFPHVNALGSYVVGGNELAVVNQLRRLPGVYPVDRPDNNVAAKITAAGLNHDVIFDRQSGDLLLKVRSSHLKLVPLLQEMGVADSTIKEHLGDDLFKQNAALKGKRSELARFHELTRRIAKPSDPEELKKITRDFLGSKAITISDETIGHKHDKVSPELYLHSAKAAIDVARGKRKPADMESLVYKSIHSIEDFVDESMKEAYPHIKRKVAYLMDRKDDLRSIVNPGMLAKPIVNQFVSSEFTRYSDQHNPLDILGTMLTVTSLGEGGIQSDHAITDSLRNVHNSQLGFMDPVHTPESSAIGVVGHLAYGVKKKGNELVQTVYDTHAKKLVEATPREIAAGGIGFSDQYKKTKDGHFEPLAAKVIGVVGGEVKPVPHKEVRYVMPSASNMFSVVTNGIPFLNSNSANRMLMADRHIEQTVPLIKTEVPLVQASFMGQSYDKSMSDLVGYTAAKAGRISAVKKDHVMVHYDGESKPTKVYYPTDYPLNGESFLSLTPRVKTGQRVKEGHQLFDTNFTKDDHLAMGTNLVTSLMPWRGNSYEDGLVISEAAAQKLASLNKHELMLDKTGGTTVDHEKLFAHFPEEREKFAHGGSALPKVGQILKPGQIVIPAVSPVHIDPDTDYGRVHKVLKLPVSNASVYWDQDVDGVVKKVINTHGMTKVYVETKEPMIVGDKLSSRSGGKGIVAAILPDNQMPRRKDGTPVDVLFNPFSLPGRVNPTFLLENAHSKIARKTGKPQVIESFDAKANYLDDTLKALKEHGLSSTEDLDDPTHNTTHKDVTTGENYWFKLKHQVRTKLSARSHEGSYTQDERPARGGNESAQSIGPLELYSLLSGGSTNFLHDAAGIKSNKNSEYWSAFQLGLPTPPPKPPMILEKFDNFLRGAGINVQRSANSLKMSPMTDREILKVSRGKIAEPLVFRSGRDRLVPEKGGLFDEAVTGGFSGAHAAHIELPERILNPLYEQPVMALLDLTKTSLDKILSGKEAVDGKYGGEAIAHLLDKIDVKSDLKSTTTALKTAAKTKRDKMLKKMRYLTALDRSGMNPTEAYTNKYLHVIAPKFRPIYDMPDGSLNVADANHGYREVLFIGKELEELKQQGVDDKHLQPLRNDLYAAVSGLVGTTEPLTRSGHFKGFISQIAGAQNKTGLYQSKIIARRQDLSGRSTIVGAPHLGIDEVGLPQEMARQLYKPYLVRELVTVSGLKPLDARKEIEDNSERVQRMLEYVMKERPVYINRAPSLHKFSVIPLLAHPVPGKSIQLNPLVFGGLNADVDGDQNVGSVFVVVPKYLIEHRYLAEWVHQRKVDGPMSARIRESVAYLDERDLLVVCDLADFPRSEVVGKKDHRTFYSVPPGVKVIAVDETTGGLVAAPVRYWSRHENQPTEIVTLTSGRQIISDNDERAVYGVDSASLQWCRRRPTESKHQLVPVLSGLPVGRSTLPSVRWRGKTDSQRSDGHHLKPNLELTAQSGYFIGAHIGDGWATQAGGMPGPSQVHFASIYPEVTEAWVDAAATFFVDDARPHMGSVDTYGGKLGSNPAEFTTRHTISSVRLAEKMRVLVGHGAENKHLPPFFFRAPDDFLLGLVAGLWDTDGACYWSHSKKKPQFTFTYSTNSLRLAREVRLLLLLLNVESHIVSTKTPKGKPTWVVQVSLPSLHRAWSERLGPALKHQQKAKALHEFLAGPAPASKNSYSQKRLVPLPQALAEELAKFFSNGSRGQKMSSEYVVLRRDGKRGYMTKDTACKVVGSVGDRCTHPLYQRWRGLVMLDHLHFEAVAKVEVTGIAETGYDLTVPGYETFMSLDGVVLSNTVAVHVPHSEEARDEAFRKLPSKQIFSPKSGDVQHMVGAEATLGLYMMTRPDKAAKPTKVSSADEALKLVKENKLKLNSPVELGGHTWTPGHFMINAALPEPYRMKTPGVIDGKKWGKLANEIAKSHPAEAGRVISQMKDLGFDASTRLGFTIDLKSLQEGRADRDRIMAEVKDRAKTDPIKAIEWGTKEIEKVMDNLSEDNPYRMMSFGSGAKNKHRLSVRQLMLSPVGVTDNKGKIVPVPITRGYVEGLGASEYWATFPGARKGIADRAVSTQDTGAFAKELVNTTINMRITDTDCKTTQGIPMSPTHPDFVGRYLTDGRLVSPALQAELAKKGGTFTVRSALTCQLPHGVCQRCAGLSESGQHHPIGFHLGAYAGTTISEPITQMVLRAFHSQGAVGAKEVGYKRIRQIFSMPENIKGKAVLAAEDGHVEAVTESPGGGWDVTIEGVRHFVPLEVGLDDTIKQGAPVKRGQQISKSGVLKVQEVAELRGHEAARDQIINDLDEEMSAAGQHIRRRIYEMAVKPMIDKVHVDDPGDAALQGVVEGAVMNINQVRQMNAKLTHPIKFHPMVMSVKEVPFTGEDPIGPLMYQRLPRTLKEGPAVGAEAKLVGPESHPLVEYAYGNIGEKAHG